MWTLMGWSSTLDLHFEVHRSSFITCQSINVLDTVCITQFCAAYVTSSIKDYSVPAGPGWGIQAAENPIFRDTVCRLLALSLVSARRTTVFAVSC